MSASPVPRLLGLRLESSSSSQAQCQGIGPCRVWIYFRRSFNTSPYFQDPSTLDSGRLTMPVMRLRRDACSPNSLRKSPFTTDPFARARSPVSRTVALDSQPRGSDRTRILYPAGAFNRDRSARTVGAVDRAAGLAQSRLRHPRSRTTRALAKRRSLG